jgi:16S rRNA (cytidine1402-2'-O)-methyltransferase
LSEGPDRRGTLYLVPVDLGGDDPAAVLGSTAIEIVRRLDAFVAENAKSARRFLKAIGHPRPLREIHIGELDQSGGGQAVTEALARLAAGQDQGLLSEAGCPGVADPGSLLVRAAHEAGVRVAPLVGPSSILLALMAAGMDGQHFAFHGYLPVDARDRARSLRELESRSHRATQIFIETPYRSANMLSTVLETCRPDTMLCIAADLTLPGEQIETRVVRAWKKKPPDIGRRRVVFLLWRAGP